jgi:hypothetical protein
LFGPVLEIIAGSAVSVEGVGGEMRDYLRWEAGVVAFRQLEDFDLVFWLGFMV